MSATFRQWLEFVFNNPVREREWYWDDDFDSRWEALELTDILIVGFMARLFREPDLLKPNSLDQIEQGLWFLLGGSSPGGSSGALLRREAALSERVACIQAMFGFFRDFVLTVAPGDFDPNASSATDAVKCAAYMWWDIFPMRFRMSNHLPQRRVPDSLRFLEKWAVKKPEIEPEIHEATLKVMSEVLDLPSELCQFSALHGLGHWHAHHPERVEQIVDAFITRHKHLRPHLIEYASMARLGTVL
jgi:hypothetical protein